MEKYREVDFDVHMEDLESRKRHTVIYRKLVVPVRMRSIYWKYFGFPANDEGKIITKDKIVCLLCKSQMIYNRNTSNLRMHLVSKHKSVIQSMEPDIDVVLESMKIKKHQKMKTKGTPANRVVANTEFTVNDISRRDVETREVQMVVSEVSESDISNIAIIFPNDDNGSYGMKIEGITPRSEHVDATDAILGFIVADLIPPNIIEGKGFNELLSKLSGKKLNLPSEYKLVNDNLPAIHNTCKEQLFSTITSNCITNMALSIEEWQCLDDIKCLSIYMHYLQNGEPCLFTKLLTTTYCTGTENEAHWESFVSRLFNEWNINENAVTAVLVSFSIEKLQKTLKKRRLTLLPCFLHLIQNLCNTHCFGHSEVSALLEKCRALAKCILEWKLDIPEDEITELEEDEYDSQMMLFDHPNLWLSSYYMIRSILLRKIGITQWLSNAEVVSEDIILTDSEWQTIFDLLSVLEPLKTIVVTLLREDSALISLLKPVISQVNTSKFDANVTDSPIVVELKNIIRTVLNEAYAEENIDNLVQMATTLDPRFKDLFQPDESTNSIATLTASLTELAESEGSLSPSSSQTVEKTTPTQKTGRSSINAIFSNFKVNKPALSVEDKIKIEVSHYQTEVAPQLEDCPLEWWQSMRYKCPNLSRLASKYLCVPAIVMWNNGGRSWNDYSVFYQKRSVLKSSAIDPLLFLHSNKFSF